MDDSITIAALVSGIVLLLLGSMPGVEVNFDKFKIRRPSPEAAMWDRIVLIAISSALLSLAVYGLALGSFDDISNDQAAQISFTPTGILFLYEAALWAIDTFKEWRGRSIVEWAAKLTAIPALISVPFIVPSALLLNA